jgi:hypothetical protein
MADKQGEVMNWDDLDRIMKSGCTDKGFIERARKSLLKKTLGVDKPIEQMTKGDLKRIEQSPCKDKELLQRIKGSIQARE